MSATAMESPFSPCCAECWHAATRPCPQLVDCLATGPLCHETDACRTSRAARNAHLRHERVTRPVIYIGTGTCGLGAGAAKTVAAVRSYLERRPHTAAEVVEVGCIGLCVEEPLLDVQLPGRPRLSFPRVTEKQVDGLLDALFDGLPFPVAPLVQFRGHSFDRSLTDADVLPGGALPWDDVPFLDEHPFFAPQTRWVLANCGLADPASLDECLARGGYAGLAKALREQTPAELCRLVESSGLRGRGAAASRPAPSGRSPGRSRPTRSTWSATPTKATRARSWIGR